jgi:hypothetical protein
MVHSTIIVSALFALVAFVSAAPRPHGSLVGVDADYIGTGDIDAEGALNNVVNANDLEIEDVLQDIAILGSRKILS